jgi:hypothetical protein
MAKKTEEATVLSTLQDLLIFQMAKAGVPQSQIRESVGLDMNRVSRIARLVKKTKKTEE